MLTYTFEIWQSKKNNILIISYRDDAQLHNFYLSSIDYFFVLFFVAFHVFSKTQVVHNVSRIYLIIKKAVEESCIKSEGEKIKSIIWLGSNYMSRSQLKILLSIESFFFSQFFFEK